MSLFVRKNFVNKLTQVIYKIGAEDKSAPFFNTAPHQAESYIPPHPRML